MAGYVMMSCSMLGEAAEQLGRFLRLLGTLGTGRHRMQRHGDLVELTFGWEGEGTPPPAMQQIFAASCAQISRWLTGRPDLDWGADFCFPQPPDISEYRRIFRGALRFGQARAKLIFPLAYLRLPINMSNPELRQMVEEQAEAVLETLQDEPEILRRSKVAITKNLGTGHATLTNVARALNMSPRTLHRRLEAVGYTFRDLVDGVRQARAETFLRNRDVSLAEIAFMLGYSEQSTFHNAFKRWTGITPNEFRMAAA
jgi:AraC-like DNA-binding protein